MATPYFDESDIPGVLRALEKVCSTRAPKVMVTADTVFTIVGGPIVILELVSECITANDTTASTMKWVADGTLGSATDVSAATATLASAAAGTFIVTQMLSTGTAGAIYANGVGITRAATTANHIIIPAGILSYTIAVGSTTGTWKHYLRYRPLAGNVFVSAAF